MGFIISKIILFLVLPPSSLIIIMLSGILFLKRHPRFAKILIITGIAALYLMSILPVSDALLRPLESVFPPFEAGAAKDADTIVILTGGVIDLSWISIKPAPTHSSLARLMYGIILYRQIPDTKLVISGGSGNPQKPDISEADAMKDVALAVGVPDKDIIIERDSRSTIESVAALQGVVGGKKIILVTSAYHIKRSAAMFRKNGMDVIPAPTDYLSEQEEMSLYDLIPTANALASSCTALYEYMGFAGYRLAGKL